MLAKRQLPEVGARSSSRRQHRHARACDVHCFSCQGEKGRRLVQTEQKLRQRLRIAHESRSLCLHRYHCATQLALTVQQLPKYAPVGSALLLHLKAFCGSTIRVEGQRLGRHRLNVSTTMLRRHQAALQLDSLPKSENSLEHLPRSDDPSLPSCQPAECSEKRPR